MKTFIYFLRGLQASIFRRLELLLFILQLSLKHSPCTSH